MRQQGIRASAAIVTAAALFVSSGCSPSNPEVVEDTLGSGSLLTADCQEFLPLKEEYEAWSRVSDEYNLKFPFLPDLGFKERLHTYEYGSDDEREYIWSGGDRPESLSNRIQEVSPFSDTEKEYVRTRESWKNKFANAGAPETFQDKAAAIWPNIEDPDLKRSVKVIAGNAFFGDEQSAVKRAFISASEICR